MEHPASDIQCIDYTLKNVHERQSNAVENDMMSQQVVQYLQQHLQSNQDTFLKEAQLMIVGSRAEGLMTTRTDDHDILLILGAPYTHEYFKSSYEADGRHYLIWNGKNWDGGRPRYVDDKGHLRPVALRNQVNSCMHTALEDVTIGGFKVTKVFMWKQTVRALLKGLSRVDRYRYVVDVIPQIKGGKWSMVEGVESFNKLSRELQSAVVGLESAHNSAIYFSLFASPGSSPLLLTSSYTVLEKEFFLNNKNLRDIVLLGKLMVGGHHWKDKYGFKSAHLKRVVMANTNTLASLHPWSGMQEMWGTIVRQLKEGSLDGFPDKNADLMWHKTEEECEVLVDNILDILATLSPAFFPNYL
ncbi:hypothetical protein Pmani_031611 [Petrolisthes manimaculis]|uniref:Uncharacterized protein n=1 Tax=Petrolisthes manimaculis TaxID=1843537 RepID=A0AAE1TSG6_9EUCA|nr:hypothetical protein Pmani_031611 [Petrolisthes manimaculis]